MATEKTLGTLILYSGFIFEDRPPCLGPRFVLFHQFRTCFHFAKLFEITLWVEWVKPCYVSSCRVLELSGVTNFVESEARTENSYAPGKKAI
jgi:hypothetical protein